MNTRETLDLLREYESRNVLFTEPDGSWPIVWERAKGVQVWDADGKKYLDLTAAFGVAAAGHANPRVVKAGQEQMEKLAHAMGDVHPHARKAELARELSKVTFERWSSELGIETRNPKLENQNSKLQTGKTIFCNSGFEAVEAALKTAMLTAGKYGVIAFHGGYHGLGYGTLNVTHRDFFRSQFRLQLKEFGHFVQFPTKASDLPVVETLMRRHFQRGWVGAVLVEPIQARGGINVPPPEFLPLLRRLCDEHKALLVVDEIFTGFGRTGKWFACEHSKVVPDVICLGKALTGGFPLAACVGRADVMDAAWPTSRGEAIHTSTFLGNPVGCAMALAQMNEIAENKLPDRAAKLGEFLVGELSALHPTPAASAASSPQSTVTARGLGLMAGLDLRLPNGAPDGARAMRVIKAVLHKGFILLPEGEHGNVISFTPPLTITKAQLAETLTALAKILNETV
ncbi:MAG TPA: aspartate aminotransferase family protein [Verrucomicrobiae bacterium]|jgi:4-aminobutyrate aminotransferase-like enzyme|nr:aspartate aminotransferase family protein [Verrucomicrobiae bacterium]